MLRKPLLIIAMTIVSMLLIQVDSPRTIAGEPQMKQNKLKDEKSPYLLQHADNPVDWYPWGDEAFEKARELDRPIFLSIGYSTCHWCHVMEHESFEDPEVARLMNKTFISIKVDREERPDIDQVYMSVAHLLTGRGGWPLTIIMTQDKKPFYAATYIPKRSSFGMLGMMDLVPRVGELWKTRRKELIGTADKVIEVLKGEGGGRTEQPIDKAVLNEAYNNLGENFDEQHGGFGTAPKFPSPQTLGFLLRYWKRTGEIQALRMVERTLDEMRQGGMYDHLGGGFHRYSTDREWKVPHFEKMLYDQALLVLAYTEAYQATGNELYGQTAREIIRYVLRDMTDVRGGFYSAEDADSEGEEGKFYTWTEDEIREALEEREADLAVEVFNVEESGNYIDEATRSHTGRNILYIDRQLENITLQAGLQAEELRFTLERAREKLFFYRNKRVRPHRDDKILTDWNGLMIAALAAAGRALDEKQYTQAAEKAAGFILVHMRAEDGRLLHRYRDGEADIPAYADDYAFFVWGLIELYEATFDPQFVTEAIRLNDEFIENFWDDAKGGFYFTADDGELLLVRTKEYYDGAVPSGNSVAMMNLLRLARITGSPALEKKGALITASNAEAVLKAPRAFTSLLSAVDFELGPTYEVVIVGNERESDTRKMLRLLHKTFIPNSVVILRNPFQDTSVIDETAPFLEHMTQIDSSATAYVCVDHTCELPTTDPEKMMEILGRN
jgi:uncharacterized protein YyaL (SSP411 family)